MHSRARRALVSLLGHASAQAIIYAHVNSLDISLFLHVPDRKYRQQR
jgi:hypothetical protein